jgi:hypothetical protein
MNHNKVLLLMMMMMMDVVCCLLFGVRQKESLFYPQNRFGNPKRCAMKDSTQSVSFSVWRLKNVFTSRNVNSFEKKRHRF